MARIHKENVGALSKDIQTAITTLEDGGESGGVVALAFGPASLRIANSLPALYALWARVRSMGSPSAATKCDVVPKGTGEVRPGIYSRRYRIHPNPTSPSTPIVS